MDSIMLCFFQIQTTLKFSHWRTQKYSTHKALDKFLDKFLDKMDEFIEIWQGKYQRIDFKNSNKKELTIYKIEDKDLTKYLDLLSQFLSNKKPKNCKDYKISPSQNFCSISLMDHISNNDTDLLNIRDEILGLINQLKYLLTLQ